MAERLQLPICMWRAQFQLLGGARRMSGFLAIVTTVIIAGTLGLNRLMGEPFSVVAGWVVNILMAIQAGALTLGGCNAIYRGILRDHQTKMIESHRLTPMSNNGVVLGYVFGSTLQIQALFCLLMVAGLVVTYLGGINVGGSVEAWVLGNLLLLSGAYPLWSATVLLGMRMEKPLSPAPLLIGISALTVPLCFVPLAGLFLNVYSVLFAIWVITGSVNVAAPAAVMVVIVNLIMTVFWISTAAAKYRRPDLPAFNAGRGLVLLLLALAAGTGGLIAFKKATTTSMSQFREVDALGIQWIATMVASLFVAAVAIAGAVQCHVLGEKGTALRSWRDRLPAFPVAVVAAAMIVTVMWAWGGAFWAGLVVDTTRAWTGSALACLLALLTIRSLFGVAFRLFKSARFAIFSFVVVVWGLPPIVDSMRAEMMRNVGEIASCSWVFGASPVGTILTCWAPSEVNVSIEPGLMVQAGLLVIVALAELQVRRRQNRRRHRPEAASKTN